ncbi:MAG TPA: hypothetical protein VFJ73_00425 [Bacillales bacterium]|nr:hypothetical protein [Bacillales bacterium]
MKKQIYFFGYVLAILFTGLAYYLGDVTLYRELSGWQPFLIGFAVVTAGVLMEQFRAPIGLIVITPFPIGMLLLLYFFQWNVLPWIYTYFLSLGYYMVLHILLSAGFRYDSLMPAWKLRR